MAVASMPMYDLPEVRSSLDSLWAGFVRHLKRQGLNNIPEKIVHGKNLTDLWNDPELWFSQCCGYDIVRGFASKLRPIATPHYGASGCRDADYASTIVVSENCKSDDVLDMFGAICVVNGFESHSGANSLKALVAPKNRGGSFFASVKVSGAHVSSLEMIRGGSADVAAIDCVTYALLESYRPEALAGIRRLGLTYRAPAIPYITRREVDDDTVARLQTAIFNAFADPHLTVTRQALYLKSIEILPLSAYRRITDFAEFAKKQGYPQLR